MRFILPMAAFALIALPALAQPAPQKAAPPAAAPSPASSKASAAPVQHHRMTMNERFAKANTTHDGHLTLAQAKAGYPTVARHFTEIDTAKKGYVTEDQIHAWEKAERDRHHVGQQTAAAPTKG